MKTLGKLILITLIIALIGFIFKMTLIPCGGLLLVISLSIASILLLIQSIVICIKFKNNKTQKWLSALMSIALSICLMYILFRYQWWGGWRLLFLLGMPSFVFITSLFLALKDKIITVEYKKSFLRNIVLPWVFVFVFGLVSVVMSGKSFYNTFNYSRQDMTYEKFIEWCYEEND